MGSITGAITLADAGDIKDSCVNDVCSAAQEDALSSANTMFSSTASATVLLSGALSLTGRTDTLIVWVDDSSPSVTRTST